MNRDDYPSLTETEYKLLVEYEEARFGSTVAGRDDTVWVKDMDDLWNAGFGIRVNSLALISYTQPLPVEYKLPKGVDAGMQSLFD